MKTLDADRSRRLGAYEAILALIRGGDHPPDTRLPSEEEMARMLGASRPTIRDALARLESAGFVVRRHGSGTYVAPRTAVVASRIDRLATLSEVIAENGYTTRIVDWSVSEVIPPPDVARDLRLERLDRSWAVARTYLADTTPAAWCLAYVPTRWQGRPVAIPAQPGELRWQLEQALDVLVTHVVTAVEAVPASGDCATALRVPLGTPLLLTRSLNLLANGLPLILGLNHSDTRVLSTNVVQVLSTGPTAREAAGPDQHVAPLPGPGTSPAQGRTRLGAERRRRP